MQLVTEKLQHLLTNHNRAFTSAVLQENLKNVNQYLKSNVS